ncbi:MAG TPA: PA2779 family protein [Burkholderiales bacterium]
MTVKALVCRLLIVLIAWTPYQIAQAGMIGTAQAISTPSQAERGTVLNFVARSDVANQLQSFGINASNAKDRVAAMTDEEVRDLAGRIQAMPAGADGADLLVIILIVAIIWWVWKR